MINKHKYPIGTKVKLVLHEVDGGKCGMVVGYTHHNYLIYVPTSKTAQISIGNGKVATWMLSEQSFKSIKKQMLFNFMYEE